MDKFDELGNNIRSAFRLLYFYNDRMLNLMNYIGKTFNLSFCYDNSLWYEPPLKDKDNITKRNKGWNWLPSFFHEFHFENTKLQFSVFLQSDTGAWKSVDQNWENVESFGEITESKTRLLFSLSNSKGWDTSLLIDENYNKFTEDEFEVKKGKKTYYCKAYELKDFQDDKHSKKTLKEYFSYIQNKGIIDLEYKEE